MGFYSNVIIPFFYDYSMDSKKINEGRKSILNKITETDILEIGFGTGINLKFYPQNVKKIIGVDANNGMLQQAKKKIDNGKIEIELINQSSESLPFPDNSIDAVVSTYTLCSIKEIISAIKEIYRVLKPGGKYYFLEHGLADSTKIPTLPPIPTKTPPHTPATPTPTIPIQYQMLDLFLKNLILTIRKVILNI